MATYTDNYSLKKPATTDLYNIADDNGNMDIIDEALGDHDEEIENSVRSLCRTNLLDNWYFPNAVNQRGQTSWDVSYAGMTVDRWKKTGYYSRVELSSTGIKIYPTDTNYVTTILQHIDSKTYELIKNKIITVSVVCSNVQRSAGYEVQATFMNIGTYSGSRFLYNGINSFTLQGPTGDYPTSSPPYIAISVSGSGTVKVVAIKLEVGENQTLAREVNGDVVLNDVPNYDEQLMRCKRFYQVIGYGSFSAYVSYISASLNGVYATIPLQVDMDESLAEVTVTGASNAFLNSTAGNIEISSSDIVKGVARSLIGENEPKDGCYYVICNCAITSSYHEKPAIIKHLKVILSTEN